MKKTICVHGHFYQPPRENPWLEYIEMQKSAYPYHDWNERITIECYLPNYAARIVNNENKIIEIFNNYSKMSFNFGPTLLSWMRKFEKDAYDAIIFSDEKSVREKNPSAIAQCYNHMIMPLANEEDKKTQVIWAIEDFKFHFKRAPIGMWLPETAVDIETLEALAHQKIKFTILAQHQIKEVKKIGSNNFEAPRDKFYLDSPFLLKLPSGKSILVFVYDGDISFRISFKDLMTNGINLAKAMLEKFENNQNFQMESLATDGETFGHHKLFGEMALASCFKFLENQNVEISSYSKYLDDKNVLYEAKINENSSWSCAHGIGRWKEDCSCKSGTYQNGNQKWRKYLRESLDFLRDEFLKKYIESMNQLNIDPWKIRNEYISIILDRTKQNVDSFLKKFLNRNPTENERIKILTQLEIQRHAMLMYTSCGWFFDDISGIETVQILRYAKRALELFKDKKLENQFLSLLKKAKSNESYIESGKDVFEKFVNPSLVSLEHVGAHFAAALLFENFEKISKLLCYEIILDNILKKNIGSNIFIYGKISILSLVTYEKIDLYFISIFLEPFETYSYLEKIENESLFLSFKNNIAKNFEAKNFETIKESFYKDKKNKQIYSFWDLFIDERNKIFKILLKRFLKNFELIMKDNLGKEMKMILEFKSHDMLIPDLLKRSIDLYFFYKIYEFFQNNNFSEEKIKKFLKQKEFWNISFDTPHIRYEAEKKLREFMDSFEKSPVNIHIMEKIYSFLKIFLVKLKINMNLWYSQNQFFKILKENKKEMEQIKDQSNAAVIWLELFYKISDLLNMKI